MPRRVPLPRLNRRSLVVATLVDEDRLLGDARRACVAGAAALEIRADYFSQSNLRPEPLRRLLGQVAAAARRPLILTLRSRAEGGHLPRGFREQDRLRLIRAVLSEASVIDVELNANDINRHVVEEAHKRGRSVILSYHNFKRTPPDTLLRSIVRKAVRLRGDIVKVVVRPRHRKDVARLMGFCRLLPFRYRIFLSMGPLGTMTRLQGHRWGSCLSYGHVRRPVAPGQPSVRELVRAQRASSSPL